MCRHVYGVDTVEKKHSVAVAVAVAVARALRSMELPPPWKWWNGCLYNTGSRESTKLHIILDGCQNLELIESALVTIYGFSPAYAPETSPSWSSPLA